MSDVRQSFILPGMPMTYSSQALCLILICPILILSVVAKPESAQASDCVNSACIDVYTLNGRIVIEAHKGGAATPKPVVTPTKKSTPRAVAKPLIRVTPRPIVKSAPVKPRKVIVRKPVVRKATPTLAAGASLSDKLTKLLPTATISHQPTSSALADVAVIYWCNLPSVFNTKVAIIGEVIDVTMRASFIWSFGDGGFYATTVPGGPYPSQQIMHTYTKPGTYVVTMLATWGGTWTHNAVARAITGEVRKLSVTTIHVVAAPTVLSN